MELIVKIRPLILTTALALASAGAVQADIIDYDNDPSDFIDATGAETLTGALPDFGSTSQGTSITLGDATVTADNALFVGSYYTSERNSIAISGPENLEIAINVGESTSFGFWFMEPIESTGRLDGCNWSSCTDSIFEIGFYLDGSLMGSTTFNGANDDWRFYGITPGYIFDEIRFAETTGSADNEFFGEMYVAKVPEPGTLALLGIGLVGAGFARRRKKAE
ncbi:PEP-CTERM sorting domain-containing protein [Lentisalinibacter orientalis]|uniref:PEP-CTERM sorting domain-containing protein n=1 Tax=Lentisalinibacter orientalis TaxID=2992241 RepID=UPI003868F28F